MQTSVSYFACVFDIHCDYNQVTYEENQTDLTELMDLMTWNSTTILHFVFNDLKATRYELVFLDDYFCIRQPPPPFGQVITHIDE